MTPPIAIVGLACRYPDATSPSELWENALAQRRAFRRIPATRLRAEDYWAADRRVPDTTYAIQAAVLTGFEFDRVRFRVAGSTYRSADLAHWLALEVAASALADAGLTEGEGLPRETTGVVLANTLTGEFSRAGLLRYRWPYVRRTVHAALRDHGWDEPGIRGFLERLEPLYKAPFPPVGEESLAGGLSNTIAGRICNHFDLKGGGYTVDGACASSLVAVATACASLTAGDLDVALVGGVDLSLDPFELVGFAKTGALAPEEMRVYDVRAAGFWPGEGCGFAVLMRHTDALAEGRRVYAVIRGWGISSDGSGGMTRPEEEGQLLALRRAYARAGSDAARPAYFEGHGTGTAVGDATELRTLARARREANPAAPPAVLGSIKANLGHTKAAAGLAGLIKATLAVHRQVLPPHTSCERPLPELADPRAPLRVLTAPEPWPAQEPLLAGVSSMGFGGINAHVVLEGLSSARRSKLSLREHNLGRSPQDAELFLFAARTREDLLVAVQTVGAFAAQLARAELADLAAELARTAEAGPWRGAVVAGRPEEFAERLAQLTAELTPAEPRCLDAARGLFLARSSGPPRIVYLFPGQGSPAHRDGGLARRRFECVAELYRLHPADEPEAAMGDAVATQIAQPAIVRATLAGLRLLSRFGLEPSTALGHSLGEISALCWGGALEEAAALRIAAARGRAMAELGDPSGAMASLAADAITVQPWLEGTRVVVAGLNSPRQTIVSGPAEDLAQVMAAAVRQGVTAIRLPVSHAFHSPLVAAARTPLAACLALETFHPLSRPVLSTITGLPLASDADLRELLCRQVTSPVRLLEALTLVRNRCDLFLEVGPGQVLSRLVGHGDVESSRDPSPDLSQATGAPAGPIAIALDVGGTSLRGLLNALGAAFVLGAPVRFGALFDDRWTKPFPLPWQPRFLANPCEQAPWPEDLPSPQPPAANPPAVATDLAVGNAAPERQGSGPPASDPLPASPPAETAIARVRRLVAARAELPIEAVRDDSRLLADLHLNSISVGQLVAEAAAQLDLPPLANLTEFANATVADVAQALSELQRTGDVSPRADGTPLPAGVDHWLRGFTVDWVERPAPRPLGPHPRVQWQILGPPNSPPGWTADFEAAWARACPAHEAPPSDPAPLPGVIVCLPPGPPEEQIPLLLEAAHRVLAQPKNARFLLVQTAPGGGGFARTLYLEAPTLHVGIVTLPSTHPRAAEWVATEALALNGYHEVAYDPSGARSEPRLRGCEPAAPGSAPRLGPADVLFVSGGGKGIAAECALALARRTGVRLALCGRAHPNQDRALAANLERFRAAGVAVRYLTVDVGDAAAVRRGVAQIESEWGPITALLHAAGTNTPQLIATLDEAACRRTLAPKVTGLQNLLAALPPERLRLLAVFSSIIARSGLPGEADYAFANEWLSRLTAEFQRDHPECHCLALEWSVWSGVGMGERLGRIDQLLHQGITPITPDAGVDAFCHLVQTRLPAPTLVVAGRCGQLPTLPFDLPDLPLWRFLETPRVHYPGIELVVDAHLTPATDPYLEEHVYHGERLFPAVLGLEAMAQAAMALTGHSTPPDFAEVELRRPVVIASPNGTRLQLAALQRDPGRVEVVLRTETTGFQADHFRAICCFDSPPLTLREPLPALAAASQDPPPSDLLPPPSNPPEPSPATLACPREPLPLDPVTDLYAPLLFHSGRFQKLAAYYRLDASECLARLDEAPAPAWFGSYLPAFLALGDAAPRDAGIHAIQACHPHARLLPIGVAQIHRLAPPPGPTAKADPAPNGRHPRRLRWIHARERARSDSEYTYDLTFLDAAGEPVEVWRGLRLRVLEALPTPAVWCRPLLVPYLERQCCRWFDLADYPVIRLEPGDRFAPSSRFEATLAEVLGHPFQLCRRPDGKPELISVPEVRPAEDGRAAAATPAAHPLAISRAHSEGLTLTLVGPAGLACDLERVVPRPPEVWQQLLGPTRFRLAEWVEKEAAEPLDAAATRLWVALECLKKAGASVTAPLVIDARPAPGWTLFHSGPRVLATYLTEVRGTTGPLVLGFLGPPPSSSPPATAPALSRLGEPAPSAPECTTGARMPRA